MADEPKGAAAAAEPAAAPASPAGNAGQGTDGNAGGSASPADNGGKAGEEQHVPYDRFKAVNEDKKHYKEQFDASQAKARQLEEELNALKNPPPPAGPEEDIYSNPDGFVKKNVRKEIDPLQKKVQGLEKMHVETLIEKEFNKDAVMQKVFGSKDALFKEIAGLAAKHGVKELTPEVMAQAFDRVLIERRADYAKAAMDMGKEEERVSARIMDGTLPPAGGGSPERKKGVATPVDRKVLRGFGWDDKKINDYVAKTEYDSDGRRVRTN